MYIRWTSMLAVEQVKTYIVDSCPGAAVAGHANHNGQHQVQQRCSHTKNHQVATRWLPTWLHTCPVRASNGSRKHCPCRSTSRPPHRHGPGAEAGDEILFGQHNLQVSAMLHRAPWQSLIMHTHIKQTEELRCRMQPKVNSSCPSVSPPPHMDQAFKVHMQVASSAATVAELHRCAFATSQQQSKTMNA